MVWVVSSFVKQYMSTTNSSIILPSIWSLLFLVGGCSSASSKFGSSKFGSSRLTMTALQIHLPHPDCIPNCYHVGQIVQYNVLSGHTLGDPIELLPSQCSQISCSAIGEFEFGFSCSAIGEFEFGFVRYYGYTVLADKISKT